MFDTLSLTDYLALMFGVYLFAAGIGLFQEGEAYVELLEKFKEDAGLGYLAGIGAFFAGVVIVRLHNDWSTATAIIVSLIGWAALIEGVLMLAFRRQFLGFFTKINFSKSVIAFFAVLCLAIGGWLITSILL